MNQVDFTIKEMGDFFETKVENLERKEQKKNLQQPPRNPARKVSRIAKQKDSNSSVVESSKESTEARSPSKKHCISNVKCSHSIDSCEDLRAMINKYKQKKKKNSGTKERTTRS